jgi:hypothetical protein
MLAKQDRFTGVWIQLSNPEDIRHRESRRLLRLAPNLKGQGNTSSPKISVGHNLNILHASFYLCYTCSSLSSGIRWKAPRGELESTLCQASSTAVLPHRARPQSRTRNPENHSHLSLMKPRPLLCFKCPLSCASKSGNCVWVVWRSWEYTICLNMRMEGWRGNLSSLSTVLAYRYWGQWWKLWCL